jgi:hypothetical protein
MESLVAAQQRHAQFRFSSVAISESVFFLLNYRDSLLQVRQQETLDGKGKAKCWSAMPQLNSAPASVGLRLRLLCGRYW